MRRQPSFKTDSYNITHTGMEKVKILFEYFSLNQLIKPCKILFLGLFAGVILIFLDDVSEPMLIPCSGHVHPAYDQKKE